MWSFGVLLGFFTVRNAFCWNQNASMVNKRFIKYGMPATKRAPFFGIAVIEYGDEMHYRGAIMIDRHWAVMKYDDEILTEDKDFPFSVIFGDFREPRSLDTSSWDFVEGVQSCNLMLFWRRKIWSLIKLENPVEHQRVMPLCRKSYPPGQLLKLLVLVRNKNNKHNLSMQRLFMVESCKDESLTFNVTTSICAVSKYHPEATTTSTEDEGSPLLVVDNETVEPICLYGFLEQATKSSELQFVRMSYEREGIEDWIEQY